MLMPYMLTLWASSVLKPMATHLRFLIFCQLPAWEPFTEMLSARYGAGSRLTRITHTQTVYSDTLLSTLVSARVLIIVAYHIHSMHRVRFQLPTNSNPAHGGRWPARILGRQLYYDPVTGVPRKAQANAPQRRGANAGPTGWTRASAKSVSRNTYDPPCQPTRVLLP